MHTRRPLRQLIAMTCVCVVFLSACASDRVLDTVTLEGELRSQLAQGRDGLDAVSCPDIDEPVAGMAIVCIGTLGERSVEIDVTLDQIPPGGDAQADPDALTARASVRDRLVAADEVAALLAATFVGELQIPTTVDCGHPLVPLPVGETVSCTATDPSGVMRQFDVTVADDGELSLSLR